MTDIISTPPAPASPADSKVATGAWWPDIDVNQLRDVLRMGGTTIPHARVVAAICAAVIEVTDQLKDWQAARIEEGASSLAQVDSADTIGGKTRKVQLFERAVTMQVGADLADRHLDLTATREGTDRAEARMSMADDFRRSATRAIRSIMDVPGVMVELV